MARTRVITKESYNKALTVQQGKTTDTQGKSTQQTVLFSTSRKQSENMQARVRITCCLGHNACLKSFHVYSCIILD